MNSANHDTFNRFRDLLANSRDSLGQEAVVLLGLLLVAGIILCFLMWRWVLRGGLSGPYRSFLTDRQVIEHYLNER